MFTLMKFWKFYCLYITSSESKGPPPGGVLGTYLNVSHSLTWRQHWKVLSKFHICPFGHSLKWLEHTWTKHGTISFACCYSWTENVSSFHNQPNDTKLVVVAGFHPRTKMCKSHAHNRLIFTSVPKTRPVNGTKSAIQIQLCSWGFTNIQWKHSDACLRFVNHSPIWFYLLKLF